MQRIVRHTALAAAATFTVGQSFAQVAAPGGTARGSQARVSLLSSALAIVASNEQQQIEVEIGPVPGEVRFFGIDGVSDAPYTGVTSLSLTTGRAQDYVEFRIYTEVVPSITLDTGLGHSDVKFLYFTPSTPATSESTVTVIGNSRDDKVDFWVESYAAGFVADWTVLHGDGYNEATVQVHAPNPSDLLSISLNSSSGNRNDVVNVAIVADAASAALALGGSSGDGEDTLVVQAEQLALGAFDFSASFDLGGAKDVSDISLIGRGGAFQSAGLIRGGMLDDELKFKVEADGTLDLILDGGDGNDNFDLFGKGLINGSPTLLGGNGDDYLKLFIDGPQTATPFIDGGAGYDRAFGFGTIINCEEVN